MDAGEPGRAAVYVIASVLGGLGAAGLGYALGRSLA
jgi:fluoride ion exporter CrcB/FEX